MSFNKQKYRNKYAAVMLLSYLFLVTLSVLHYHHIDIQEGNYTFASQTSSNDSGPFDKLIDVTHECTIQQFANTVLDYNFIAVFDQIRNPYVQNIQLNEILLFPSKPHYQNLRLRAPPSIV